jgi:hypothetical protein
MKQQKAGLQQQQDLLTQLGQGRQGYGGLVGRFLGQPGIQGQANIQQIPTSGTGDEF